jgi:hypothetical protein
VSTDGGATWIDTSTWKVIGIDNVTQEVGNRTQATLAKDSNATFQFGAVLNDVNQPTPTHITSQETQDSAPSRWNSVTEGAGVYNAIQLILFLASGGPRRFNGGTISLAGYRTKGSLQTIDCTADPQTEYFIGIPAGHTIASIYVNDVDLSGSGQVQVQASVGGVPDDGTTDYRQHNMHSDASGTAEWPSFYFVSNRVSGGYGHCSIWGLNVAAPLVFQGERVIGSDATADDVRFSIGFRNAATSYNQIRIWAGGPTMNGGTIYVQTYSAKATILMEEDFAASPAASHDITGLTEANAGALVVCSLDLAAGVSDTLRARVMVDGVPDSGASDYTRLDMNTSTVNVLNSAQMTLKQSAGTSLEMAGVFLGIPQAIPTQMVDSADMNVASNTWSSHCSRRASQVEDGLHLFNFSANNWVSGTAYGVGYRL